MKRIIAGVVTRSHKIAICCIAASLIIGSSFAIAQSQPDTIYEYDALGRLVKTAYGNGAIREYYYDAAGNRRSVFTLLVGGAPSGPVPGAVTAADGAMIFVHTLSGPILVAIPTTGS